jgi:hypothetical protein
MGLLWTRRAAPASLKLATQVQIAGETAPALTVMMMTRLMTITAMGVTTVAVVTGQT